MNGIGSREIVGDIISIIMEFLLDLILQKNYPLSQLVLLECVISINKANIYFRIRSDYPQSCRP
jgi:hypothetical protein